jgi:hypothetical protein
MRKIVLISAAAVLILALSVLVHAESLTIHHAQNKAFVFASARFPGSSVAATPALQNNKLTATKMATNRTVLSDISFNTTPNLGNVKRGFGNNSVPLIGGNGGTNILRLSSTSNSLGFNATVAYLATSEFSKSRDLQTDVFPELVTLALFGTMLAGAAAAVRWRQHSDNEET